MLDTEDRSHTREVAAARAALLAAACFAVEALPADERALADTLLARGLDNEAFYTLAGPLKPISSLTLLRLQVARPAAVPEGSRAATDSAAPELARMRRYQRVANALSCGPVRVLAVPYRLADSARNVQLSVVHRALLDRVLARDQAFWGQWGLVPGSDPGVVLVVTEFERPYDRFRGYGYLFGYPEHAVHFFVEAARLGDAEKRLVPRDFFQIPVHSRETGRFTYAVPRGYLPAEVDERIRADASRDQRRGAAGHAGGGIDQRAARRPFRPAAQAGAEARRFRRGRAGEEAAAVRARQARAADRATVDPCRGHAHEEDAVEARIARTEGAVAARGFQGHAGLSLQPDRSIMGADKLPEAWS